MNINLHQHHWSKSPAHNTSTCHYVLCSRFEMHSAQFLSSSCPNAASLVTITRNSTNSHMYCGTRGSKFHLSPRWRGQVFCGAPCPICNFLAFFRVINRTIASCFPGASTSVMCPMFRRCIRSFSCLVWRLDQSSDTFRSRAEWSPFVLKGAWCYRGNPGLSLLSCDSLQIEFICVHWNFVRKHLACQLCRPLLRSFVTPVKQPMASTSVRLTYSMRLQRCLFTDACTWMFAGDFLWRTGNCHE